MPNKLYKVGLFVIGLKNLTFLDIMIDANVAITLLEKRPEKIFKL